MYALRSGKYPADSYNALDSENESEPYEESLATSQLTTDSSERSRTTPSDEEVFLGQLKTRFGPIFPKKTGRSYRQRKTCASTNENGPHHSRTGPYQACYTRDLPDAPRCDINSCKGLLRTAEGCRKIIQNFEKLRLHENAKVTIVEDRGVFESWWKLVSLIQRF